MKKLFKYAALLLTVVPLMLIVGGCGAGQVCTEVAYQDSVICSISEKTNVSPESISNILLIANTVAIESDAYTADEAQKFVTDAILALDSLGTQITYGSVVNYLLANYAKLSPAAQAIFIIIDPLDGYLNQDAYINIPLTEGDINLLKIHLNKQLQIIQMFKVSG